MPKGYSFYGNSEGRNDETSPQGIASNSQDYPAFTGQSSIIAPDTKHVLSPQESGFKPHPVSASLPSPKGIAKGASGRGIGRSDSITMQGPSATDAVGGE